MLILIVDDEERARSLLKGIIDDLHQDSEHKLIEAENLTKAVELIEKHGPNLVFMDIEMPGNKGTELLNYLPAEEINFKLVFTTAYEKFALKAFEMNALDYLLKPIRPKKVAEIIKTIEEEENSRSIREQLQLLKSSLMTKNFQKIGLPLSDGVEFVPIEEIIQMQADGMYTNIILKNQKEKLVSKPLKHFTELMEDNAEFLRPHRSHLINMRYIKQYINKDGGFLVLENEKVIPIARNRKQYVLERLS